MSNGNTALERFSCVSGRRSESIWNDFPQMHRLLFIVFCWFSVFVAFIISFMFLLLFMAGAEGEGSLSLPPRGGGGQEGVTPGSGGG